MILTAIGVLGVAGLLLGLGLGLAHRRLAVAVDPRIAAVRAALAGGNCGACGFPGCDAAAAAVVAGEAPTTVCTAGGQRAADGVAAAMGVAAVAFERTVALVFCRGGAGRGALKYRYAGAGGCRAALLVAGGPKACAFGCVGLGDCTRACPRGAIVMGADGIPVVDPARCAGCGLCAAECPRGLIRTVPAAKRYHIRCSSHDRGPAVTRACSVGCTGCTLCARSCPNGAITVDRHLAVLDYAKCAHAGACLQQCPRGTIVRELRRGERPATRASGGQP